MSTNVPQPTPQPTPQVTPASPEPASQVSPGGAGQAPAGTSSPTPPPASPPGTPPPTTPGRRDGGWPGGRVVAAIAGAVLAALLIVHYTGDRDDDHDGADTRDRDGADHTPTLAADGLSEGRLVISGGTDRLTVVASDLGADLVRAATPEAQRAVPVLRQAQPGEVSVSTVQSDTDGGGGTDLTVRLSRDVRWDIAVDGGTSLLTLDLDEGRVRELDVSQGVSTIRADLPHPDGLLRTRIGGGAGTVHLTVPSGVPARATFSGGAGSADLDGVGHGGLAAGTVLTSPDEADDRPAWESSDRVEVALDSGIGNLDLEHRD
ncbi:hypothetical protein KIH74_28365 [Kineosporia sp. J2-2]|uniref:Adhesin domain-containing protein n=1 Tax=Kineosporia corallincola TaxID=2835133 RepID=A0ABS5TP58_9ACTN|nr:hypothetical protein [Kineosporia corallincola]MBT0772890.1 hypothetical protein [Kineosporia corallincola]